MFESFLATGTDAFIWFLARLVLAKFSQFVSAWRFYEDFTGNLPTIV